MNEALKESYPNSWIAKVDLHIGVVVQSISLEKFLMSGKSRLKDCYYAAPIMKFFKHNLAGVKFSDTKYLPWSVKGGPPWD